MALGNDWLVWELSKSFRSGRNVPDEIQRNELASISAFSDNPSEDATRLLSDNDASDKAFRPPEDARRLSDNDVIVAGREGLLEAIDRFDLTQPYRLSTFAREYIFGRIRQAVKDWRRRGEAGETRADRFVHSHSGATVEEVAAAIELKTPEAALKSAEEASVRAAVLVSYSSYDESGLGEDDYSGEERHALIPAPGIQVNKLWWDSWRPFHSSPQVSFHGRSAIDRCSKLVDALFEGDLKSGQRFLSAKRKMLPNVSRRLADDERVWRPPFYRLTADGSLTTEERSREQTLAARMIVEGQAAPVSQPREQCAPVIMLDQVRARAVAVVEALQSLALKLAA